MMKRVFTIKTTKGVTEIQNGLKTNSKLKTKSVIMDLVIRILVELDL